MSRLSSRAYSIGQLLGDRLDEAAHDHRHRLVLGHAAGHQVEQLVVGDLGDARLVAHRHVVLADVDVGVGVAAADLVDQQRVAQHVGLRAVGALVDLDQPAVRRAAAAARNRLAEDARGGVRSGVDHLGAGVLVLALAGERDRERLALGVLAHQVDGGVLHGHLGADVAVDPLHGRAGLAGRALGDEVVDVVRPVLDRRVAAAAALLHDDLDHRGVQRVAAVDRRGAALDVVHVGVLVDDDQGPLELAHVLGVDPEVGLQRDVDVHARRHVDEGATGPHRGVERGELVVADRDHGVEVLLEQLRVLLERRVGVLEDDALRLEVLADRVVDDLRLVLRGDAGHEALLLRLGDAELVVGVLDVLGEVLPRGRLLLAGADEVLDVVEVDARQVGAPGGHGLAVEELEALQAQVEHPLRLGLLRGDVAHDLLAEAALGDRPGVVAVGPAELVAADALQLGVELFDGRHVVPLGGGACRDRWSCAGVMAGCRWCRHRRRGRWWPGAARGGRGRGRWPRSRPRTAAGTRGRRGRPGSAAGTAARRRRPRGRAGAATARTRRNPRWRTPGPGPRPASARGGPPSPRRSRAR